MKSLPPEVLEKIYFHCILPSSTYRIAVCSSCSPSLFEELEKVHRRAARIIHKIPKAHSFVDVLKAVNWKPVLYAYKKRVVCLTHQGYYEKYPGVINNIIDKHSAYMKPRENMKLVVPRSKTNFRKFSFRYRSSIIWNALLEALKQYDKYDTFKRHQHKYSKDFDNISFHTISAVTFKDKDNFY